MACYRPLTAYREYRSGVIRFSAPQVDFRKLLLPCGQCIGCRLDRSLQWAVRCMHEASLYEDNCFITLTYSDEFLPPDGSLNKAHFQKFMKRLRKRFGSGVRYYHCGEYGEKLSRPHYHACLFNVDFPDKVLYRKFDSGNLYVSAVLAELWPFGFSTVGEVTFESAAYVARYVTKKITGDAAAEHYEKVDLSTGEIFSLEPEYTTMSRRPGIGSAWFEKFGSDVFPWDEVVVSGRPLRPPRYYASKYELADPEGFAQVKVKRLEKAFRCAPDNEPARLRAREVVKHAQFKMLKRSLEDEA